MTEAIVSGDCLEARDSQGPGAQSEPEVLKSMREGLPFPFCMLYPG